MKRLFQHSTLWEIGSIILVSLLPLFWFSNGYVLLGHDSGFRLDYGAQLPNLFYSWDPKINFGVDWSMFKGFLITQFPETIFSILTRSFAVGEKFALVFWFAIMGLGMYVFLKNVFTGRKYIFLRVFTSIFYMYNFYILNAWGIGERAKFSLYAALPIGLLLLYNVFIENKSIIKNGIVFGFLYLLLNGGGVYPLFGATLLTLGFASIVLTSYRMRRSGWKEIFFSLKVLLSFFIPFLLLNSYYIIPNIYLLLNSFSSTVGSQGGVEGLIAWERVISKSASLMNLLRLQGMPDWYDNPIHPYANIYLKNLVLIVASFIPTIIIAFGLIIHRFKGIELRQKMLLWILVGLIPIGLLFTMGTHPPTGILYEFAMKKIPGFVMFRSSFYKFAPALWFPMIVLSGYFLNRIIISVVKGSRSKVFFSVFIILLLLLYHFPYFTTDAFALSGIFSTRVKIPTYVESIQKEITNAVQSDESILVLPKLDTNYIHLPMDTYTWGYFSLDIFPRNAINRRFVANDSSHPMVQSLYKAFYSKDAIKVKYYMAKLGIRYVLFRSDVALTVKTATENPPQVLTDILNSSDLFIEIYHNNSWIIYSFGNASIEPHIFGSTNISLFNGTEIGIALIPNTNDTNNRSVFIETESSLPNIDLENVFYEAPCIMCNTNEYQKLVDSIVLPNQRLLPSSKLFFIQRYKDQKQLSETNNNPEKRIDVDLALMQNSLSYAKRLSDMSYLSDYQVYLEDALKKWRTLEVSKRNEYAIRIQAYIDAHGKNAPVDIKEILLPVWNTTTIELKQNIWISEGNIFRFIVDIKEDGEYIVFSNIEQTNIQQISINGINSNVNVQTNLLKGRHAIELHVAGIKENERPILLLQKQEHQRDPIPVELDFHKIDPTKYSVRVKNNPHKPFLLVFKEEFDKRWKISDKNAKQVRVDGYENGWIISNGGVDTFEIYYEPQQYFYFGLFISSISIILFSVYFLYEKRA